MRQVPLFDVVSTILPDAATAAFLQAALRDGPEAHAAWDHFRSAIPSLPDFLRSDRAGLKRLLPLLEHNVRTQRIAVDRQVGAILRSAAVRERVRFRLFADSARAGMVALADAGLTPLVLKGAAAACYYPAPHLRHCHDLDLLLDPADVSRAATALSAADFGDGQPIEHSPGTRFSHRSGLPIECHHTLLGPETTPDDLSVLLERSRSAAVLGTPVRVLAPADQLAHLCGHALQNPRRRTFAWVADAYLLIRHAPDVWDSLLEAATDLRVELPALVILTDLRDRFGSPVPEPVLIALRQAAARTDRGRRNHTLRLVRQGGGVRLPRLLRHAGWRSRWAVLRALLTPDGRPWIADHRPQPIPARPGSSDWAGPSAQCDGQGRAHRRRTRADRDGSTPPPEPTPAPTESWSDPAVTRIPSWQPTVVQQDLLEACLLDGERARVAFQRWRERADLDTLDTGSARLLPLLWRRQSGAFPGDPVLARGKAEYRRAWCLNQVAIARGAALIGRLEAAGIPAMYLKGAALAVGQYGDPGVRPMDDIDIAVPRSQARAAVEALVREGWVPGVTPLAGARDIGDAAGGGWEVGARPLAAFDEAYFFARHAHGFEAPDGVNVDLHWCLFQGHCDPGVDDAAWAATRTVLIHQTEVRVPDPADHLLLLLAHGARWNPIPAIRWIADAVTLIRREPDLAWDRLIAEAQARRITLQTTEMLADLEDRFAVGVPPTVLVRLRSAPVGRAERNEYRIKTSEPSFRLGLQELRWLYARHRAFRRHHRSLRTPAFPGYVRHVLDAPGLVQVGSYAVAELRRRTRRPRPTEAG